MPFDFLVHKCICNWTNDYIVIMTKVSVCTIIDNKSSPFRTEPLEPLNLQTRFKCFDFIE